MLDWGERQMLTELSVQSLKVQEKRYMRADRDGLYIEIVPGGKRKKTSIGRWPEMSLKEAREELIQAKRSAGIKCLDLAVKQIADYVKAPCRLLFCVPGELQ